MARLNITVISLSQKLLLQFNFQFSRALDLVQCKYPEDCNFILRRHDALDNRYEIRCLTKTV